MSNKIIHYLLPIQFCNIHRMNPCNSVNWMLTELSGKMTKWQTLPFRHLSVTFQSYLNWPNGRDSSCVYPNYQRCGSPTLKISKRNAVWFDISIVSPILWKFLHFTKLSKIKLFLILKLFLYRESMYKTISKNSIHWKEIFFRNRSVLIRT